MAKQTTQEDADLIAALGVELQPEKQVKFSAREERIIAGFEDIQRFVEEHERLPAHGEDRDIFERLYAIRLDRIQQSEECMTLLEQFDKDGLLKLEAPIQEQAEPESDEELLAALGVDAQDQSDIMKLQYVRSQADRKAAEEIARREPCEDFEQFKPLFDQTKAELDSGKRQTLAFKQDAAAVEEGDFFILGGIMAYVESIGELKKTDFDREDGRIRVIFANGTESNMLLRSFQRALYKTDNSRRISNLAPMFADEIDEDDAESGHIYVLRSLSNDEFIAENRKTIHKIGVTVGSVKSRIANAKKDPTYLLAEVEIVQTFKLANINRKKLEQLLQKFFAPARIDMRLKDRFGSAVEPREWFLVPLPAIGEAVELLMRGELHEYRYDESQAKIVEA